MTSPRVCSADDLRPANAHLTLYSYTRRRPLPARSFSLARLVIDSRVAPGNTCGRASSCRDRTRQLRPSERTAAEARSERPGAHLHPRGSLTCDANNLRAGGWAGLGPRVHREARRPAVYSPHLPPTCPSGVVRSLQTGVQYRPQGGRLSGHLMALYSTSDGNHASMKWAPMHGSGK